MDSADPRRSGGWVCWGLCSGRSGLNSDGANGGELAARRGCWRFWLRVVWRRPLGQGRPADKWSAVKPIIQSLNQETLIKQSTSKAIINWNAFSILSGQSVVFQQPNAQSIALNRVLGGSPSAILGTLTANGQVWLINPNGVLFGKARDGQRRPGLLATTADIANSDFLSGNYNFGIASANPNAEHRQLGHDHHAGRLNGAGGAYGGQWGHDQARLGTVAIGAGKTFAVDFDGDNLLSFAVTDRLRRMRQDRQCR